VRVRAKDIAQALGFSEATVSLALNNRAGVKEETRKQILEYKENASNIVPENLLADNIAVIVVNKQLDIVCDSDISLWSDVLGTLEGCIKERGSNLSLIYHDANGSDISQLIERCNTQMSGIILFATEMAEEDIKLFKGILKPLIVYDNDFCSSDYQSITIDNFNASRKAVDYLVQTGHKSIGYISHEKNIYNFAQRRLGFNEAIKEHSLNPEQCIIHSLGSNTQEIYQNAAAFFSENANRFDAILTENYQVSIGILQALQMINLDVPQTLSIIGIDELPSYIIMDNKLTFIKIENKRRAEKGIECLYRLMENENEPIYNLAFGTELVQGDTVRNRNKQIAE